MGSGLFIEEGEIVIQTADTVYKLPRADWAGIMQNPIIAHDAKRILEQKYNALINDISDSCTGCGRNLSKTVVAFAPLITTHASMVLENAICTDGVAIEGIGLQEIDIKLFKTKNVKFPAKQNFCASKASLVEAAIENGMLDKYKTDLQPQTFPDARYISNKNAKLLSEQYLNLKPA